MKPMNEKLNTLVVYHANCVDGITAAAITVKHLLERQGLLEEEIHLYPMSYDDDVAELYVAIIKHEIKELYIVDFSITKEQLLTIEAYNVKVHLYDHHASAFRKLMGADYPLGKTSNENFYLRNEHNDITSIHIVLDNAECGASLCWKHLINTDRTAEMPELIKYVKDYDLWQFTLPTTAEISKFLKQQSKDLATYTALLSSFENKDYLRAIAAQGVTILRYESKLEDDLIREGVCPLVIEGVEGLAVNAPYAFSSSIGHKLAVESKTFGAVWSQLADGKIAFSLRSNGDECDVSKLAECMGGGGHKNAAGFSFMSPSYDVERGITLWSKEPEVAPTQQEERDQ